jgi:hypothetical protein
MRKLAIAAGLVALAVATPAVADGRGGSPSAGRSSAFAGAGGSFNRVFWGAWGREFATPHFSPRGRHFGWFRGKHWGWFKPHHPHWPHQPPHSP